MSLDLGIGPGLDWWEASALTTAPSLHTCDVSDSIVIVRELRQNVNQYKVNKT